ncbi:hypothetical protein ANCDUO_10378 [Ancylostoma duodenale]|uniref:Uncharacterized protein n=1 Tax=Ancylostoma duodenale TaxID=51022 RepID=A0A0C2DAP7_9BILA|nr:hypothetical protein ANCDUO_10378 [Ancylostoma duodenale]
MLEVATGTDCSYDRNDAYPVDTVNASLHSSPTVDESLPEMFPLLIQVPRFDPMISCVDFTIEGTLHMNALGLGDILVPGEAIVKEPHPVMPAKKQYL